jgi:biopolymer transport protein ExbB/TolQ
MPRSSSTLGTVVGILVALVAVVGSQFLGWEWGGGQLVPTIIGVVVAVVAIVLAGQRALA